MSGLMGGEMFKAYKALIRFVSPIVLWAYTANPSVPTGFSVGLRYRYQVVGSFSYRPTKGLQVSITRHTESPMPLH